MSKNKNTIEASPSTPLKFRPRHRSRQLDDEPNVLA